MKKIIFFFLFSISTHADSLVSCFDGDTCKIKTKNGLISVRLDGVDAPESDQPFGNEAKNFLVEMLMGKKIDLKCKGVSFKRKVCSIYINKLNIQNEMVVNGWAMDSPKYSGGKYKNSEALAKSAKLGMWQGLNLYSPYCWRWLGTSNCNKNRLYQE